RDHIDHQIEENLARGMSEEEARRAARQAFGNAAALREQAHDAWIWSSAERLLHDVRLSARTLRRTPGFASIATTVIALGSGANVALFSIVRPVLLNPLAYSEPDRLVRLYENVAVGGLNIPDCASAGGMFTEWREHNRTLADVGLAGWTDYNLSSGGNQLPE